MSNYETLIPSTWAEHLKGGKVCLGLDVASTIEDKSNPSSLTVMEQWEGVYYERLVVRWKTEDMDVMESMIRHVLDPVQKSYRKALVVDKSNEKFAANKLRKMLAGEIRVIGFAGNNTVIFEGEKTDAKTAMGSAYCAALEDGIIAMPAGKWLRDDHRLVKRNGAKFECKPDKDGNHADTFDSGKLAYWGFVGKGFVVVAPEPGRRDVNNSWAQAANQAGLWNNQHLDERPFA